ncbi:MAG: MFS transporter [Gammaproteobacteria bacterium]|nr:MFS transporter [Gammaproteobacteria bacterium]
MNNRKYFHPQFIYMLLLGFSSGLPFALTSTTLQAWFAASNLHIKDIGFLSLVGLPYILKFLWAPMMDRWRLPFLGHRRGWMLITQLMLLATIAFMAWFTPKTDATLLAALAFVVAFFSASQDIVLDAYRTDITAVQQRGLISAIWLFGWRIATLASAGGALIAAQYFGWHSAILFIAAMMLIGIISTLICEAPKHDHFHSTSLWQLIIDASKEFLLRRYGGWLLLFIVLYKLGDAAALSLSTTFYLRELGFSLATIGGVNKSVAIVATILGALLGGMFMLRLRLYSSLLYFGILQAVSNVFFTGLALVGKSLSLFMITVFVEHFTGGMGTAAFFAFLMALCDRRYTAMQFALFSALASVGRIVIGPIAGYMVNDIGWPLFFLSSFIVALPGLGLLLWLRKRVDFE